MGRPFPAPVRVLSALAVIALTATASAQPASPLWLANAVGSHWNALSPLVAAPDSGAVVGGEGTVAWRTPSDGGDHLEVVVAFGIMSRVTTRSDTPEGRARLAAMASRYRAALGPPADAPFWTLAQIQRAYPDASYVDVALVPETGQTILREPFESPPAMVGPPPPDD